MLTCTACNKFTCRLDEMMVLHQAICESLDEDKREFRMAVADMMYGEHLEEALDVVRSLSA